MGILPSWFKRMVNVDNPFEYAMLQTGRKHIDDITPEDWNKLYLELKRKETAKRQKEGR